MDLIFLSQGTKYTKCLISQRLCTIWRVEKLTPTTVERKELMKNTESIKKTRLSVTTISQRVDEANIKLMLINEKIQALKAQQEEHKQLISSGMELLSLAPSIEDLD